MNKLSYDERGFITVRRIILLFIIIVLGVAGYIFYHDQSSDKIVYKSLSPTTKASYNPYADWATYTSNNKQVTLRYPSDWAATNSDNNSNIAASITSAAFLANTAGITAPGTSGINMVLQTKIGTYSGDNFCSDISCKVVAVAPLNNPQLNGDSLAVINESYATKINTVYAVVSASTKVGYTSASMANVGSNQSISGLVEFSSPSTSTSTLSAPVTDVAALQANNDFTELITLINTIKFSKT